MDFSDYRFLPCDASVGDGTVLAPFEALEAPVGAFGRAPSRLRVRDLAGRDVVYDGGGPTYFVDSEAGTKEFAGWSYFEEDATEDRDGPCIQLFVLAPGFPESSFPGVSS